jgi:hypothetical protein
MTEIALFDMEPAEPEPAEKLSAQRKRTARQQALIKAGLHPLGRWIRLHPDASRSGSRTGTGPRCGDCVLAERSAFGFYKCTRGRTGEYLTPSFREGPFETRGDATTLRLWWPACEHYSTAIETDKEAR